MNYFHLPEALFNYLCVFALLLAVSSFRPCLISVLENLVI